MLQTGATRPRVQLQRDFHQNSWRNSRTHFVYNTGHQSQISRGSRSDEVAKKRKIKKYRKQNFFFTRSFSICEKNGAATFCPSSHIYRKTIFQLKSFEVKCRCINFPTLRIFFYIIYAAGGTY